MDTLDPTLFTPEPDKTVNEEARKERAAKKPERDSLRTQLAERDAECAKMREALGVVAQDLCTRHDGCTGDAKTCLLTDIEEYVAEVLSSSAGCDMLERLKRAERVANASVALHKVLGEHIASCLRAMEPDAGKEALERTKALEAVVEAAKAWCDLQQKIDHNLKYNRCVGGGHLLVESLASQRALQSAIDAHLSKCVSHISATPSPQVDP